MVSKLIIAFFLGFFINKGFENIKRAELRKSKRRARARKRKLMETQKYQITNK